MKRLQKERARFTENMYNNNTKKNEEEFIMLLLRVKCVLVWNSRFLIAILLTVLGTVFVVSCLWDVGECSAVCTCVYASVYCVKCIFAEQ